MTRWTSNLLATAIILVAALGLGRHLIDWSGRSAEDAAPARNPAAALPAGPVQSVEFATGRFVVARRALRGDQRAAAEALRAACRQALAESAAPAGPADERERRLLEFLVGREPQERLPGGGQIHELHQVLPLTVAVQPAASAEPSRAEEKLIAGPALRMVAWGMAVPAGEDRWSVYLAAPGDGSQPAAANPAAPRVPLPPGCRRVLSLAGEGGSTTAFTGDAAPRDWKAFFDGWARRQGHRPAGDWQRLGNAYHRQYHIDERGWLDVQMAPNPQGGLYGMLTLAVTPALQPSEQRE